MLATDTPSLFSIISPFMKVVLTSVSNSTFTQFPTLSVVVHTPQYRCLFHFVIQDTTDVMGPVLVSVDGKNKVLEVHCEFHDSPTALGCVAYIAENPENPNITSKYFIGRNGSSSAHARINLPPECVNISSSNITVFCWKEDGTVGNTSIPVQVEMKYLGKASSPSGNHRQLCLTAIQHRK